MRLITTGPHVRQIGGAIRGNAEGEITAEHQPNIPTQQRVHVQGSSCAALAPLVGVEKPTLVDGRSYLCYQMVQIHIYAKLVTMSHDENDNQTAIRSVRGVGLFGDSHA